MLSRRDVLKGAGIAGVSALARPLATAFGSAAQPKTPISFNVPPGACDCHACIIGDPRQFPFVASRGYTPESTSITEMRSVHRSIHTQRVVIVQPSFYGTDNSCTLDAIRQLGRSARGVAVIADNTSNAELDQMHSGGIRGIVSSGPAGESDPAAVRQRFKTAVDRVKGRDWHVQFHGKLPGIDTIKDQIATSPVPIVLFDHFGGAQPGLGLSQPGFNTLLSLVQSGKVYVDVSAPYRISKQPPDYTDVAPIAKALIAANPERIIWGTGWPHPAQIPGRAVTEITPLYQIDDGHNLNLLATWTSDAAQLKLILVDNPARLYGFSASTLSLFFEKPS